MTWFHRDEDFEKYRLFCPNKAHQKELDRFYGEIGLNAVTIDRLFRGFQVIELKERAKEYKNSEYLGFVQTRARSDLKLHNGDRFLWFKSYDGSFSGTDIAPISILTELERVKKEILQKGIEFRLFLIRQGHWQGDRFKVDLLDPAKNYVSLLYRPEQMDGLKKAFGEIIERGNAQNGSGLRIPAFVHVQKKSSKKILEKEAKGRTSAKLVELKNLTASHSSTQDTILGISECVQWRDLLRYSEPIPALG